MNTSGLLKRKYLTFVAFIFPQILTIFKPLPVKLTRPLVVGCYTADCLSMLVDVTRAKEKQQLCLK